MMEVVIAPSIIYVSRYPLLPRDKVDVQSSYLADESRRSDKAVKWFVKVRECETQGDLI